MLRWRVPKKLAVGPLSLRLALVWPPAPPPRRILRATPPVQSAVGPAPVYCAPPPPIMQDIPAGDGWITGGDYIEGGPYPGVYECVSQPYTVSALDGSGAVVASQRVAGGHSFALVVPAGTYKLRGSSCGFGSATVTAGRGTHADVVCPVP